MRDRSDGHTYPGSDRPPHDNDEELRERSYHGDGGYSYRPAARAHEPGI